MLIYQDKALVNFSYKLSKLHKSVLPKTVAFTLNDAAKDVKKVTLLKHANKGFNVKKAGFFKACSGYKMVGSGFNIAKMKSTAGMIKRDSYASEEIANQQTAVDIGHRTYLAKARADKKRGKTKSYKDAMKKKPVVGMKGYKFGHKYGKQNITGTRKSNFVARAQIAFETNRPLLYQEPNWNVALLSIVKNFRVKNGVPKFKLVSIATFKKGRSTSIHKKIPFVNNAALDTAQKLREFYIKNATKQIEKMK